jgi:DNA-binding transcriptional ArsR family regulator
MLKGIGKALQDAIDKKETAESSAPAASPLLNAHRRRILEYLSLRPFTTGGKIASDLKMSSSSVIWHLRSLVSGGYVVYRHEDKIYYPKDFVDPADADLFITLRTPKRRDALRSVVESPGISQVELSSAMNASRQTVGRVAFELKRLGLVTVTIDGRFTRLYPTNALKEKQEKQHLRARAYVERILTRLEVERQSPQVLRRTETEFQVKIGKGRGKGVLSIPLDPYGILAG